MAAPRTGERVSVRSALGRRSALILAAGLVTAAASLLAARSTVVMAANPAPPFAQCPAVGTDTGCAILVVIQPDGSLTILSDPTQKPFDKGDDTLVGVLNNSGISVPSISVGSSTQAVFGFEAPGPDGLCAFSFVGSSYCKAIPKPTTGYEGPSTTFSGISANKRDGTVKFTDPGGLRAGASTYFSLENAIVASKFGAGAVTTLVYTATSPTSGDHADAVTVGATLRNGAAAVPNAVLTFTLAPGPASVSCVGTTNSSGVASCTLVPVQRAGTYPLTASYAGSSVPFLAPLNTTAPFTVTLEQDTLTYTGPSSAVAGQPLLLSGVLTTDDPTTGTAMAGRTVTLTLGAGLGAVGCNGVTDSSGSASCSVTVPSLQSPGNDTVSGAFVSDGYYVAATVSGTVAVTAVVTTPDVGAASGTPWAAALLLALLGAGVVAVARRLL
jgi:hypothetical protein